MYSQYKQIWKDEHVKGYNLSLDGNMSFQAHQSQMT